MKTTYVQMVENMSIMGYVLSVTRFNERFQFCKRKYMRRFNISFLLPNVSRFRSPLRGNCGCGGRGGQISLVQDLIQCGGRPSIVCSDIGKLKIVSCSTTKKRHSKVRVSAPASTSYALLPQSYGSGEQIREIYRLQATRRKWNVPHDS